MRGLYIIGRLLLAAVLLASNVGPALAQTSTQGLYKGADGSYLLPRVMLCPDPSNQGKTINCPGAEGQVYLSSQYPYGATPETGNATGTTSAVVGTLAGAAGHTTYICGFQVSAVGGTAAIGPVTIAGLVGSSMVFQWNSAAIPVNLNDSFSPCIPASAANTAITITTTADGTATAVDVNSWGYYL